MAYNQPTPVQQALMVCQANAKEIQALETRERLNTLHDFEEMTPDDVSTLASKLEKRTVADGRIILPQKLIKNVQALSFWCSEWLRQNIPLNADDFTAHELNDAKWLMRMQTEEQGSKATIKPDKFDPKRWKDWSNQFDVYLSHHKGAQFAPLNYIIRPEPLPVGHTHATKREANLYRYLLTGAHFPEDNMVVFRMLSELVTRTPSDTWIRDYK